MEGSIEQLLSTDRSTLSRDQQLDHLSAVHALISRASAELERDLAVLSDPDDEKNFDRDEIACLLHWSSGYTQARIVQAHTLVRQLPGSLAALSDGTIGPEHARALAEGSYGLSPAACGKLEHRVLERAGGQTVTELKRSITRAVKTLDPRGYTERHSHAQRRRDVSLALLPDGMAGIWSTHTVPDAEKILSAVQARADRARGDARLVGERRADALRDLILGTLTPLPAAKPVRHRPITIAAAFRYEPCPALREKIELRDRTCRFPGCNRRSVNCEIDHVVPFNGHNTIEANLQALCVRHHHLKHEAGWHVHRHHNGTTEWTSPTRRTYLKPPPEPDPP